MSVLSKGHLSVSWDNCQYRVSTRIGLRLTYPIKAKFQFHVRWDTFVVSSTLIISVTLRNVYCLLTLTTVYTCVFGLGQCVAPGGKLCMKLNIVDTLLKL